VRPPPPDCDPLELLRLDDPPELLRLDRDAAVLDVRGRELELADLDLLLVPRLAERVPCRRPADCCASSPDDESISFFATPTAAGTATPTAAPATTFFVVDMPSSLACSSVSVMVFRLPPVGRSGVRLSFALVVLGSRPHGLSLIVFMCGHENPLVGAVCTVVAHLGRSENVAPSVRV
jgi:hypothetical protein